jgi:predicted RNA polymerase sigma factor
MENERLNEQAHAAVEAVALRSRGKLVAFLAARFGDLAAAEDAVSDALAAALLAWPEGGCPANPEAWLLTAARNTRPRMRTNCPTGGWRSSLRALILRLMRQFAPH